MELDYNDISIAGIDAEAGCMLYDYETDVYLYILQAFVESVPASVEKLRDLSQETPKKYFNAVHGIKGSFATIGAEDLRKKAFSLEEVAATGDLSGISALNDELIEGTEQLIRDIQSFLDKIS